MPLCNEKVCLACRFRFWVDIIAWIPFDYAIIEAIWPPCYISQTARYVSLLKLLRLVRRPSDSAAAWVFRQACMRAAL